jgi:hypothetical protein
MIVRILLEGQYDVPEAELDTLNKLDSEIERAVGTGAEDTFRSALHQLLARVREVGTPLADESLKPSEIVLPAADASIDDVRELLGDEGLVPG